jgi:5-methylcytosine-specific restriction enzyme A
MPYAVKTYKSFIQSRRWKELRRRYLALHPLCERCHAKGRATIATEVHHRIKCHDNAELQTAWDNLEAICQPCHAPLRSDDIRGYSRDTDADGYHTDPRHWSNQPRRSRLRYGTDATKIRS